MDYLGRNTEISFEAIDGKTSRSLNKHLTMEFDPLKVTYIEHPKTKEKLYVKEEPYLTLAVLRDEGIEPHKTYCFNLDNGYKAMYCEYYKGGNWVFIK